MQLESYRVIRELGSGGHGVVFLAERADGTFDKKVAIKVLEGVATADGIRRLKAERQILAELDHPGIARLLDGGETADGQPYLVLELVEGELLYPAITKRRLGVDARLALFADIARAVAHAHQRLVVHRDIKPNNIMVTAAGSPRLLDFGVARLLDQANDESSTRVYSPRYASPEQLVGGRITTRTDVYALGVILLELLTSESFAPVSAHEDLLAIARTACATEPEDRYATVDALLADLDRWHEKLPVRAREPTLLYRASRFTRRNRLAVSVGGVAIAATVAFVVTLQRESSRARRAETEAVAAQHDAERDAGRARNLLTFVSNAFDAHGAALPARDVVTAAARSLASASREDKPTIALMLAGLATRLGETDRALSLSALAIESMPAGNTDELARAYALRASALVEAGENEPALAAARKSSALAATLGGTELRAFAEYQQGLALAANADVDARPILERVIIDAQRPLVERLRASRALADLALQLDDPDTTLKELSRTRELARGLPDKHPLHARQAHLESWARWLKGESDAAYAIARKAIADYERDFGKRGALIAELYNDLASLLSEDGRFKEAMVASEQSIALYEEVHDRGMNALIAVANAGTTAEAIGDYPRALTLMRQAVADGDRASPPARIRFKSNLARTLALMGHVDEARPMLSRLIDEAIALEPDGAEQARGALRLAQLEIIAGRPAEARAAFARGAAAFAKLPPFVGINVARVDAEIDVLEGKLPEARERLAPLEAQALELWGDTSFDTACVRAQQADVLTRLGKLKEARTLLAKALPVMRDSVLPAERNRAKAEALARRL